MNPQPSSDRGVPIRAISRCIAVLQTINRGKSLTLQEIAINTDLPYATAFRIVQTLMHEGMIECEPYRKLYRATALIQTLSYGFQDHGKLVTLARPHIVALTKRIAWPIALTTRVGQGMMVRDSTHQLTSLTFNNYYAGHTMPMLECASGHVYLAHASEEERATVIKGLKTVKKPSAMLAMFETGKMMQRIRKDGYATTDRNLSTSNPGKTSSISVPIFDKGGIAGTVTMIFFSSAMPMQEAVDCFVNILKQVASDISADLNEGVRTAP